MKDLSPPGLVKTIHMINAELRVVPVGAGTSMQETVDSVCEALEECEVDYQVGPVGTTFEVDDVEELMETLQSAHEAALETAPRVITTITIDQRSEPVNAPSRPTGTASLAQHAGRYGSRSIRSERRTPAKSRN